MNHPPQSDTSYRSRLRTSTRSLYRWTAVWLGTCALMAFGPRLLWNKAPGFTLLAVGLNACVGIGMIVANKKYLMEQDELQRKIMLNAMGVTLGIGMVVAGPL